MMETNINLLALDPISMQRLTIDMIKGDGLIIEDPTNPMIKLAEAGTASIVGVADSIINLERKLFPTLARHVSDLHPHFINGDEIDMFATPSETTMRVMVSVNSILNFGAHSDNNYTFTIPKESFITIESYKFMIMNDIKIKINNKMEVFNSFVELLHTDPDLEFNSVGSLNSSIFADSSNVLWVIFDVPTKQLDLLTATERLISSYEFKKTVKFSGRFYYTDVYSTNLNGDRVKLKKVFSDDYYDPTEPSVLIKVNNNEITYQIDAHYIGRYIKRNIEVQIYTTQGKLRVDMSDFNTKDFTFTVSGISDTIEKSVSSKMNYLCMSTSIVDSGVNERTFGEIKERIINRTSGESNIPITEFHIRQRAKKYDFTISKALDLITDRVYIAYKSIDNEFINSDMAIPTITNSRTLISSDEFYQDDKLIINDDYTLIKPGKLFKHNNGAVTPLLNVEKDLLTTLSDSDKRIYLNNNPLSFSPFLYIIDNNIKTIESRVYDINTPIIDFINIDSKNTFININVNIVETHIFPTKTGYDILLSLSGNKDYQDDSSNIHVQMMLRGEITDTFYHSVIDIDKTTTYFGADIEPMHYISIESNMYVSNSNMLTLTNGFNISGTKSTLIEDISNFIIYTTNGDIVTSSEDDAKNFLVEDDIQGIDDDTIYGLSKEHCTLTLANRMENLWNRVDTVHTGNRYKRYENVIYARYEKDIYEKVNGRPFTIVKDDEGNCSAVKNILHNVGDIIEVDGEPVVLHNIGDVKLDDDNEPIIDAKNGLSKYVDIIMLEYSYIAFNKIAYVNRLDTIIKLLRYWVLDALVDLNSNMLEQTSIMYRPMRNNMVVIDSNDNVHDTLLSPTVIVFFSKDTINTFDKVLVFKQIGIVLDKHFGKRDIFISEIEQEIETDIFSNALSVDIKGFTNNDEQVIRLKQTSNRFTIKKTITSDYEVGYNFNLKIKYI